MTTKTFDTLSSLLIKARILTSDQITHALQTHQGPNDSLDLVLTEKKLVSRSTLLSLLSDHYQIPFISLPEKIDIHILKLIPEHIIDAYKTIPLNFDAGTLTAAMIEPTNEQTLDRLAATTGLKIKPVGILEGDYRQFYARYFEDTTMTQILKEIEIHQKEILLPSDAQGTDEEKTRPMVKLVDSMFALAARKRASDIHLEPQDEYALIRFRIDGVLQTQQIIPKPIVASLTARIKVMSGMDITDRRSPQDGQFRHHMPDREIDVRVATVPSRYGEKIAMRILDRRSFLVNLDMLGMSGEAQTKVEEIVSRPNGLFLVTGPTGAGKTTTLYAIIQKLRSPRLNIMTLEDPIEYELLSGSKREGGITQIQVNPKVGLSFSSGLRACLRQDPDVIFVGEIRDRDTAEVAISAALTGHMVLSTIHTNGAIQTITRLLDMGVEPFLIVSALRAVVSQRLIRVLCHQCKQPYSPPVEALKRLGLPTEEGLTFYKPQGCGACMQQGYWGRTGVFELLPLTNELNRLILEKKPAGEVFAKASQLGFRTLKQDGMNLVTQGITTIEEILRALPSL